MGAAFFFVGLAVWLIGTTVRIHLLEQRVLDLEAAQRNRMRKP